MLSLFFFAEPQIKFCAHFYNFMVLRCLEHITFASYRSNQNLLYQGSVITVHMIIFLLLYIINHRFLFYRWACAVG